MELSKPERAQLLQMMQRSLTEFIAPELQSQKARDVGRLLADMLDQLALEASDGEALTARYVGDASRLLLQARELIGTEAAIAQRIDTLLREGAGTQLSDWRDGSRVVVAALYALREKTPQAMAIARDLLNIERDFQLVTSRRHIAAHEPTTIVAEKAETLQPEAITKYLRKKFPELPHIVVREVLPLAGGRSKETLLLKIEHGAPTFPAQIVMRRDRAASINTASVVKEYALIRAVYDAGGVPMPKPYHLETDATLLDGAFLLLEKVDGEKVGDFFPEVQTPDCDLYQLGEQEARILARLHSLDLNLLKGTNLDLNPDLRAQLQREIQIAIDRAYKQGEDSPPSVAFDTAAQWLRDHLDYGLIGPIRFLHGDIGLHNQLVKDGVVTAILDWELPAIGSAAQELGYCRQTFSQLMPWDDFVRTYQEAGGAQEACDPKAVIFYRLYVAVTGFSYTKLIRHMVRRGITHDITHGHAGYLSNLYGERSLTEALLDALALDDH